MGFLDFLGSGSLSHYGPHRTAAFEGWYSKFRLPSGASLALIVSMVPKARGPIDGEATSRTDQNPPYMISFTYCSADSSEWFQREFHPRLHVGPYQPETAAHILQDLKPGMDKSVPDFKQSRRGAGFTIKFDEGSFSWSGANSDLITWRVQHQDFAFVASTTGRSVHWIPSEASSTPAGYLANFPLPIQWHVHSLDTPCLFDLSIRPNKGEARLLKRDTHGTASVHCEKNWAVSFPDSYIWLQARDHDSRTGVCVAGGSLLPGIQAFLIGYQGTKGHAHSFSPPTSTSILGFSLGTTAAIEYREDADSKVVIAVKGWFTSLIITATAPCGTFFPLSAPLRTGHARGYTVQSFAAEISVQKRQRSSLWGRWVETGTQRFAMGSLEFGGNFYRAHQA